MKSFAALSNSLSFSLLFLALPSMAEAQAKPQVNEVSVGVRVWQYDRVYPLLDGLFEDVVSSQVAPLLMNNNSPNASNLDAVVQSLQIQAGYGQLAGIQNSVASQMAVANLGYQSVMAQQAQGILQQQLAAQQQLYQAQQDLQQAQTAGDSAATATANQKIQAINANIANLSAQAGLVKAPSTPWVPASATGNIANPTTAVPAVPSSILSTGTVSGGPSFPATKQLDNQVDLLWLNVRSLIAPVVTYISPDSTSWTGQNLNAIFRYLEVGPGTPGVKITCLNTTSCGVDAGPIPKQNGILYIASAAPGVANRVEIALMKLNTNGTLSPISYQAPKAADQPATTKVIGADQTPPPAGANQVSDANNQTAITPSSPTTPAVPAASRNAAIMTVPPQ